MKVSTLHSAALAAALATALMAVPAPAQAVGELSPIIQPDLLNQPGFLRFHPDLRHQRSGMDAWDRGDAHRAFDEFRQASRYGNKLTQAMVAEMLWTGQGTVQDRALGYAWMDLAAERGYAAFLGLRERYWDQLDAEERERALVVGKEVYAEYGDAVAKPRLEAVLRRGRGKSTGSRVGAHRSAVEVYTDIRYSPMSPNLLGPTSAAARHFDYYDDRYWVPERYWRWQDRLQNHLPRGAVTVLPARPVD